MTSASDSKLLTIARHAIRKSAQHGLGRLHPITRRQGLPAGAPDAGDRPEHREQLLAAARADARDVVQFGSQVSGAPGRAVEGDGETVRLNTDALNQPQRGVLVWQRSASRDRA
jgi:hypothetical protein